MERKIPVWVLVLVVFLGLNFTVVFGWCVIHVYEGGEKLGKLGTVVVTIAQFPSLLKKAFFEVKRGSPLLVDNLFPDIDGFKKNGVVQKGAVTDGGYLLLSVYDNAKKQSIVKLIRIGDQQVLYQWVPKVHELGKRQNTVSAFFSSNDMEPSRFQIGHPLLHTDGSIVFNSMNGPLFKINACSKIVWEIDGVFHHSVEQDSDGYYWVPSVIEPSSYDRSKFVNYRDDAIAKVSPSGEVRLTKSVSRILEENGYRGLLFGAGPYDKDAVHLNSIQAAYYSTKYWEKGDLLLSLRHRSTVFIYRPSTNKIIWLKTGPWLNQHDADFIGQSEVSIFGNDVISYPGKAITGLARDKNKLVNGQNNIYLFDFADGSLSTPYHEILKQLNVSTQTQGRQELLVGGDVVVEESNSGRILRISPKQAVWEFTAKVDNASTALMGWSRYLTKEQVKNILPILDKSICQ